MYGGIENDYSQYIFPFYGKHSILSRLFFQFFFSSSLHCVAVLSVIAYSIRLPFSVTPGAILTLVRLKQSFFSFIVCKSLRIDCVSVFMSSLFRSIMDRVFVFTTERTEHMNISLCRLLWYCIAMLSYAIVVVIAAVLKLMFTKRLCYGYR